MENRDQTPNTQTELDVVSEDLLEAKVAAQDHHAEGLILEVAAECLLMTRQRRCLRKSTWLVSHVVPKQKILRRCSTLVV